MNPKFFRGTVAVAPTSTSLAIVDVRDTRLCVVAVKNLDAVQTLDVTIRRRCDLQDDFAEGQIFDELTAIAPLEQVAIDVDCGVQMELEVVGVASGAGLDALVTVKPDWGRR